MERAAQEDLISDGSILNGQPPRSLTRRHALATGLALSAAAARAFADTSPSDAAAFAHSGRLEQGGVLYGLTEPNAPTAADGKPMGAASSKGLFVVGFDRDAPPTATVAVYRGGAWAEQSFAIAPVEPTTSRRSTACRSRWSPPPIRPSSSARRPTAS